MPELSRALEGALPQLWALNARTPKFAGLSLADFRARVVADAGLRAGYEAYVADQIPPPPPPPPRPPPRGARPRVALVVPGNIFFWDSDEAAKHTCYRWSTRATGGLVATHALVRYLATFCALDVLALDEMADRACLYEGARAAPQADGWDGIPVVRAPKRIWEAALDALNAANEDVVTAKDGAEERAAAEIFAASACDGDGARPTSAAARAMGLKHEAWDAVIVTQFDHVKFALERVAARHKLCPVHDQHSLPWGPWPPCVAKAAVDAAVADECRRSAADFARCTLLCTSDFVRRSVGRDAPAQRATTCYGADYAAYGGRDPPRYDLRRVPSLREGAALTREAVAHLYALSGKADAAATNFFATLVSPCAAKGAGLVAALAAKCPDVPFLCVATRWTRDAEPEVAALKALPNVVFAGGVASERMDAAVWRRTRVLLAPSLWPEPFGLVAVEAALRGIPVLSTRHGGLAEAVADRALPCRLLMDVHVKRTWRGPAAGDVVAAFEADRAALRNGGAAPGFRPATARDVDAAADPFAAELRALAAPDALARASDRAYAAAAAHVRDRNHALAKLLRGLDAASPPPWVRTPAPGVGGPEGGDCNRL